MHCSDRIQDLLCPTKNWQDGRLSGQLIHTIGFEMSHGGVCANCRKQFVSNPVVDSTQFIAQKRDAEWLPKYELVWGNGLIWRKRIAGCIGICVDCVAKESRRSLMPRQVTFYFKNHRRALLWNAPFRPF